MTKSVQSKLKFLREFQQKYPTSHIGGSVGLMLHGIDLKRNLDKSDLDVTIDELNLESFFTNYSKEFSEHIDISSNTSDFDGRFVVQHNATSWYNYTKVEIRINPEPSFDVIGFEGHLYNVSKLRNILFWKEKYAKNGSQKHIEDLFVIKFGTKPNSEEFLEFAKIICPKEYVRNFDTDELPF